jgi:hypothetical protein
MGITVYPGACTCLGGDPRAYTGGMLTPAEIRHIPDPVDRIRAVNETITEATALTSELADITRETVREMKTTMSYGEIARALGVSRGRAQQLAEGK